MIKNLAQNNNLQCSMHVAWPPPFILLLTKILPAVVFDGENFIFGQKIDLLS